MSESQTANVDVVRVDGSARATVGDALVVEEPLEIRVGDRPIAVTMRTPGDDFDLATGFLVTEGIVARVGDIDSIRHWGSPNVARVVLRGVQVDYTRLQRNFYAASSCGICGKASIDAIRVAARPAAPGPLVAAAMISALPDRLRERQSAFTATGGLHAAALFDATGGLLRVREDVGRHNAVDKVIGAMLRNGEGSFAESLLVISGRAGFEVVQKAAVAGIPMIIAVGAPTSLAVDLAREMAITLAGFVRDGRFNLYCGEERVV